MTAFDELIDKLKNIESDLIITLSDVINDNSDKLEEAQKNQILKSLLFLLILIKIKLTLMH